MAKLTVTSTKPKNDVSGGTLAIALEGCEVRCEGKFKLCNGGYRRLGKRVLTLAGGGGDRCHRRRLYDHSGLSPTRRIQRRPMPVGATEGEFAVSKSINLWVSNITLTTLTRRRGGGHS
jgi:hypothetical protein